MPPGVAGTGLVHYYFSTWEDYCAHITIFTLVVILLHRRCIHWIAAFLIKYNLRRNDP